MRNPLRIRQITNKAIVFQHSNRVVLGSHFIVDLDDLPIERPRNIVIHRKIGKRLDEYRMPWRRFLKETAIGSVAMIPWSHFKHRTFNGFEGCVNKP